MALFQVGPALNEFLNQLLQSQLSHRSRKWRKTPHFGTFLVTRLKLNPEKGPKVTKNAKTCIEPENMVHELQVARSTAKIEYIYPTNPPRDKVCMFSCTPPLF
jgi:hypothetical protein